MLFWIMLCAAVGVVLFVSGAFTELSEIWSHPEHRFGENESHEDRSRTGRDGHPENDKHV